MSLSKHRLAGAAGLAWVSFVLSSQASSTSWPCDPNFPSACVHAPNSVGFGPITATTAQILWANYNPFDGGPNREVPTVSIIVGNQVKGSFPGNASPQTIKGLTPNTRYSVVLCATYPGMNPICDYETWMQTKADPQPLPSPTPSPTVTPTPPPAPVDNKPRDPRILSVSPVGSTGTARVQYECAKNNARITFIARYKGPGINTDPFEVIRQVSPCPEGTRGEVTVSFASKPAGSWEYLVNGVNAGMDSPGARTVLGTFVLPLHSNIDTTLPKLAQGKASVFRDVSYHVTYTSEFGFAVVYPGKNADACEDGDAFRSYDATCFRQVLPNAYLNAYTSASGINIFRVDTNPENPGVFYAAVGNACPYGGSLTGARCQIAAFTGTVMYRREFNETINLASDTWVDDNPRWPGIYSKKSDGICSYGGTPVPNTDNCDVRSLPDFPYGLVYWIDSAIERPGLYYQPIEGRCSKGGVLVNSGACLFYEFKGAFPLPKVGFIYSGLEYFIAYDGGQPGVFYYPVNGRCDTMHPRFGDKCRILLLSQLDAAAKPWIDLNPSWPGIYYKPQNGYCNYGGIYGGGNCKILSLQFSE